MKPWRNKKYQEWVAQQPCAVCQYPITQAHHVRTSYNSGTGQKPPDYFCVPLCYQHHRYAHSLGMSLSHQLSEAIHTLHKAINEGIIEIKVK